MAGHADDLHVFHGRSETVLAVTIVMITLSTIFVFFRIVSRGAIVKRIMIDDYFILAAWILAFGLSFAVCYGTGYGLGRHEDDVPTTWQRILRESVYAASVMYQPALMATKTSILAFYLSLTTVDQVFKWACIATLFVVNAGGLALTFVTAFQCHPVNAMFLAVLPPTAHCTDILTIYLASIPLNLITDIAILLLPMPILTSMRLPRKQKIILIITFSFGVFVAIVDVVRISYLQDAAEARFVEIQSVLSANDGSSFNPAVEQIDSSWYLSFTYLWTAIEVNIGIMCACVPALKPLVARFMPAMLKDEGDSSRFASISDALPGPSQSRDSRGSIPEVALPEDVHHRDFGSLDSSAEGPLGMMDFLTTPEMTELPIQRTQTAMTNSSRHTAPRGDATLFDFVKMKKHRSMVQMSHRESVFPIAMVTILFFIWGFEYGLLNVLNHQFQKVAHVTSGQISAIHSAYYAGYLAGPLTVGRLVLNRWGFKMCFPIGMLIYAAGLLIYWPAAVLTSWPTFVVTNFIVGFGLSVLETACNPFVFLCGPPGYGEIRLNLSQGLQAIGSVVAPLIANKAFFHKSQNAPSLVDTQWAYLGIALATVMLAIVYFYVPLPDATDAELADADERPDGANKTKVGSIDIIWISLALGVFSQFCYVGGQEVNATSFSNYLVAFAPTYNAANFEAIAHTAFAVSRFVAAGLGFWIKPRHLLCFCFCGAIVFDALSRRFAGGTGVAMLIMVYFMEGPIFSLIFAQSLRGMGKHTRLASVLVTSAISGGAVFVPISNHLRNAGRGAPYALIVAVAAFAAGAVYAFALIAMPKLRNLVEYSAADGSSSRPSSTSSGVTRRALSLMHRGKKRESPGVEYRERKSSTGEKWHAGSRP